MKTKRAIRADIDTEGVGSVELFLENTEDLWELYNLIRPGPFLAPSWIARLTRFLASSLLPPTPAYDPNTP